MIQPRPPWQARRPNGRAFTLIELLIVMAIMGVLLALAIPAFTGIGRGQGMRSSVAQLRSTLSLARQWAVTRNEKTYVIFPEGNKTYNPASRAPMALRSYAVWTEKSGYISEWRYLPPGVIFDSSDPAANNLFNTTNDRVFNVAFPSNAVTRVPMYCVSYLPNGRLNQTGGKTIEVYLREGWVDVNTNSGAAAAPTIKPNSTYRMFMEMRPLTGQIRIREL